jgi:hypothetical protein
LSLRSKPLENLVLAKSAEAPDAAVSARKPASTLNILFCRFAPKKERRAPDDSLEAIS